jgi:ElaB/YqjD/DUF883 family membrane-anchored ribosome-binding protein
VTRDDDDVSSAKINQIAETAKTVGKKPTYIWVAVAAFVVGLILGLFL